MRKILLSLVLTCFTLVITAQQRSIEKDELLLNVGFNAINSLGTKNPFADPGDWAFKYPLAVGIETRWNEYFTIEIGFTINGFKQGQRLDAAGAPSEDLTYFSIDTSIKHYLGEYIFPETDWIDFYATAGIGFFKLDEANTSINAGGGVIFWLNRRKSYGIRAQGLGKFALDHSNSGQIYPNNHFQYSLSALIRL